MAGNLNATTSGCGVHPITSIGSECGGQGTCVLDPVLARPVCMCDSYWQGESDFQVTTSLVDCQINVVLIQVLWALFLTFHLVITVLLTRPKLTFLWRKHQTVVEHQKANGKRYSVRDNKGLFALLPYITFGWLAQFIMAIIKIADQNHKIGHSVLVTVFYIIWRTTFIFCPDNFQPALVASLLRSERNLDHVIALNRRLSLVHMVFFMSLSVLIIIPMIVPQDPFLPIVGMSCMAVFCILAGLSMFFLAVQAMYIENRVNRSLVHSYAISKDARTAKVMQKMAINQRDVIKGGLLQFFVYALFGCFPYLWNKHDYLVPFSWVFANIQINRVMNSLIQEEGDKSSSKTTEHQVVVLQDDLASSFKDSAGVQVAASVGSGAESKDTIDA